MTEHYVEEYASGLIEDEMKRLKLAAGWVPFVSVLPTGFTIRMGATNRAGAGGAVGASEDISFHATGDDIDAAMARVKERFLAKIREWETDPNRTG